MTLSLQNLPDRLPHISFRTREEFAHRDPGFHPGNLDAGLMALPGNTEQVSELLRCCHEGGIPVVTQGGRTGLSGGAVTAPDQLILDTSRMNRIESIDPVGGTAIAQCGVTLSALEASAREHGLSPGIDLAARDSATLGGMAATNAGGIEAFRNGIMRNRILGLEVVLADGRVYQHLRRVTKANEGLHVCQLFIGAEGTLGIITRLSLSLLPRDPEGITALAVCPTVSHAVDCHTSLRDNLEFRLLSSEAMWSDYALTVSEGLSVTLPVQVQRGSDQVLLLLEATSEPRSHTEAFEEALSGLYESGSLSDVVIARNDRERQEIWRIREDSFAVDRIWPHGVSYDVSVPLDSLDTYTKGLRQNIRALSSRLKTFIISHLADGNIHVTISSGKREEDLKDRIDEAVYSGLDSMGGSFSAEHGIGIEKQDVLWKSSSPVVYQLMQQIKTLLDPKGILNPGKVVRESTGHNGPARS